MQGKAGKVWQSPVAKQKKKEVYAAKKKPDLGGGTAKELAAGYQKKLRRLAKKSGEAKKNFRADGWNRPGGV